MIALEEAAPRPGAWDFLPGRIPGARSGSWGASSPVGGASAGALSSRSRFAGASTPPQTRAGSDAQQDEHRQSKPPEPPCANLWGRAPKPRCYSRDIRRSRIARRATGDHPGLKSPIGRVPTSGSTDDARRSFSVSTSETARHRRDGPIAPGGLVLKGMAIPRPVHHPDFGPSDQAPTPRSSTPRLPRSPVRTMTSASSPCRPPLSPLDRPPGKDNVVVSDVHRIAHVIGPEIN